MTLWICRTQQLQASGVCVFSVGDATAAAAAVSTQWRMDCVGRPWARVRQVTDAKQIAHTGRSIMSSLLSRRARKS